MNSNQSTTFKIDDAETLKASLQATQELLKLEWQNTVTAWKNLATTWDDRQREKFETTFEHLLSTYQSIETETETHIQTLSNQIQIAQRRNDPL